MADDSVKLELCGAVSRFLNSADLSDFIIRCNGSTHNVHRLILCLHSDRLAKWCSGDFKEAKGYVDLSLHELQHIGALVRYLYTFDYNVGTIRTHVGKLSFHVNMCVIADKYNITGLKNLAINKFRSVVVETKLANELVEPCIVAYDSAPATVAIRQSIVAVISSKRLIFLPSTPTEGSKALEDIMRIYPDLAIDVARCPPPNPNAGPGSRPAQCVDLTYRCPKASCRHEFRTYLPSTRQLAYTCPKCAEVKTGDQWNLLCRIA